MVDKCIKEFLDKILAPKPVVRTVPKKNFVIALAYLGQLSLQIRTRINCIMKHKHFYCNIRFVFRVSARLVTFLHLHLHSSAAAVMLPVMTKLIFILKTDCVNTWKFLHSQRKELKVMMILPWKNIFYSAITTLILKIS